MDNPIENLRRTFQPNDVKRGGPRHQPGCVAGGVLTRLGAAVRQRQFDGVTAVQPIRMAVSSGHGIGKSTLVAWIVDWIMSTRTNSRGTITANTFTQVQDKTWAAIRKWTPLCLTGPWFEVTAEKMRRRDHPESQFCSATSCREENSEAFAGQHEKTSSSFYIFDEASAVPDSIYEVAEGGLTDGEPMIFLFGNPTRSTGMFHRACFGSARNRWDSVTIDSRDSAFTNKAQINEWLEDYGEDSDFFRVRVRGLPPAASDLQFIDAQSVFAAQQRAVRTLSDDALVCGLDVARGGGDWNVFRFRRGSDARSVRAIRIPGEETRDSMRLITKASEVPSVLITFAGAEMSLAAISKNPCRRKWIWVEAKVRVKRDTAPFDDVSQTLRAILAPCVHGPLPWHDTRPVCDRVGWGHIDLHQLVEAVAWVSFELHIGPDRDTPSRGAA